MSVKTSKLLFAVISSAVFGREIPEELYEEIKNGLQDIYKLAKRHDLAHLLFDPLCKCGIIAKGDSGYSELEREKYLAEYRMVNLSVELQRLTSIFSKNKINNIPLKGSVIRKIYPEPYMRTSCDIDVLVQREDFERACNVLLESGNYTLSSKSAHDVSFDSSSKVHIELHFDLVEEGMAAKSSKVLMSVWDSVVSSEDFTYEMTEEMFYFYHIAHMAKHFEFGGTGIRPFVDLVLLDKDITENQSSNRDELLKKGGLMTFCEQMRVLSKVWFFGADHTELTASIEAYILDGGVYGTDKNQAAAAQVKSGGRFKSILSLIFLPYDNLKILYPSLEGKKILLPFYWVRRWFRVIFKGRLGKGIRAIKTNATVSKESRDTTAELFSKLGL